MARRVAVVGGGLAGLATAAALAPRGFSVSLFESRPRLGGRASSFHDAASGLAVDNCQHVSMGCCTNLAHFCQSAGVGHLLQPQPCLFFMTPDRRVSTLDADPLPAPLHLGRSFARARYLSPGDKARVAWGLCCLRFARGDRDEPFLPWLRRHAQSSRAIERFWGVVLTSALNESLDRVGLKYARKVFVDGFLRHRRGFVVELPTVPLGQLYGDALLPWLDKHGVEVYLGRGVRRLLIHGGRVEAMELRDGECVRADWYVAAVPPDRLLDLLPEELARGHEYFSQLGQLETSPITSVHVWYDRPVCEYPHLVLVDCTGQWVFNRGQTPAGWYLQVVVSASRQFRGLGHDEVKRRVLDELGRLLPAARAAAVLRARVVTEHSATFSAVPGVDRWRPAQTSPVENLFVAGDWTATGWPATMEGAVRSGYLAAEALLRRTGQHASLVQPDLG